MARVDSRYHLIAYYGKWKWIRMFILHGIGYSELSGGFKYATESECVVHARVLLISRIKQEVVTVADEVYILVFFRPRKGLGGRIHNMTLVTRWIYVQRRDTRTGENDTNVHSLPIVQDTRNKSTLGQRKEADDYSQRPARYMR